MDLSQTATIVSPDGSVAIRPTVDLSPHDARILRDYERLLHRLRLKREAIHCQECWDLDLMDGTRFRVTEDLIWIECRCKVRKFQGRTL